VLGAEAAGHLDDLNVVAVGILEQGPASEGFVARLDGKTAAAAFQFRNGTGDVVDIDAEAHAGTRADFDFVTLGMQSDQDIKAIFAYLHSIPAIKNDVPAPKVPDQAMDAIAASYDKLLAKMKGQAAAASAPATVAQR